MPMHLQFDQTFLRWQRRDILDTEVERTRPHLHFLHPAADRMRSKIIKNVEP